MPRTLPVADGVIKHQLYFLEPGGARMVNPGMITLWSWKATGSPVSVARMTAEQDAIESWVRSLNFRHTLWANSAVTDIRSWDYGLDPAPRTARFLFPYSMGTMGFSPNALSESWIVAFRSQPVGSPIRDRLNGRVAHPYVVAGTPGFAPQPSQADVVTAYAELPAMRLDGTGDKGKLCVVSYYEGGAPRAVPQIILVNHVLVQRFGVQRRRTRRPGPYAIGS